MAYRIRPSKQFSGEIIAVATTQMEQAIGFLRDQPQGPHEAIHDARKKFKRIRALYRLVEPDAPEFRKTENARIRDMAHSLSRVRDATALVETVQHLQDHAGSEEEGAALAQALAILTARRDEVVATETDLTDRIETAITTCERAIAAARTLSVANGPQHSAKRLEKAWRKNLEKAADMLAGCREEAGTEHFHELRKCAQTYWMYLALLRDIWPSAMRAKHARAKQLIDLLGHEHDLAVLMELVNEQPDIFGDGETLALVLGAIINRQQTLRSEALALADEVFADKAEQESRIIEHLWRKAAG